VAIRVGYQQKPFRVLREAGNRVFHGGFKIELIVIDQRDHAALVAIQLGERGHGIKVGVTGGFDFVGEIVPHGDRSGRNGFAASADDQVRALAELGMERLLEYFAGLSAIIVVGVKDGDRELPRR